MNPILPIGFRYAGVTCGIKESGQSDLTLIVSEGPVTAAGVYTQNVVRAPSIEWNEAITPSSAVRAIVINSGNANACTGELGAKNVEQTAAWVSESLGDNVSAENILVLSTGIIGVQLPMESIQKGIETSAAELNENIESFNAASLAICTSDNGPKRTHRTFGINGETFSIAAMAKGAGMIGPRMATMLGIITTDVPLTDSQASAALKQAVDVSFNCISVEGHTSTNDAVILLAPQPGPNDDEPMELEIFQAELTDCCIELAKMIPADGEGATHLIEVQITGAENDRVADQIARAVASSNLVKTAITGADPNWGRIVSAIGILDVQVDPRSISLAINDHPVFANGEPLSFDAREVSQSMAAEFEVKLNLSVGAGSGSAVHWSSDLTVNYVRFNSEYTT